ncbi:MAG: hypothetical protein A3G32_02235 [Deltaproteobacteria bacterium RIFCSPLOWO2_12_FULL_40_28]|nr:MAG: hypothetical protein A3C45_02915 [Deltaproteobacteria bacterium RIFCSPHIGHO2_02_FULL_40_28]OGQ20717.1 MAG: hypothetical protein A3E27_10025 [Deltaproteobacteria bacterium RIFCSPHIGHO2_12_FULL_40_32]OGQ38952.1 MAG: hypothetical protein A3I69_08245 [Deltaproteobacteria bacterium RIFCSPLOWO2_02_FULL_40_36]OGQ55312.1 MAG: hypothetical protein A3G32_02235 [Deltaproteobacteria bacterium RIFCSPLOWO2_12_FULL_40_28]
MRDAFGSRFISFLLNPSIILSFFFFISCSSEPVSTVNPLANRGKQIYMANCISCHSPDPRQDGPLGPAIHGSSKELLEYRLLKRSYPPSYSPKRPSTLMPRFEHLAGDIEALTSYLNE